MKKEEYSTLFEMEDTHWWYLGHRELFSSILDTYCPEILQGRILDAGCGTGGFIQWYKEKYDPEFMAGVEISDEGIARCRIRGLPNIQQGSVEDIPFPDASFDLVVSLNVLNHYEVGSDILALSEMKRVLRPRGFLLLNLPAHHSLRGRQDLAVGDVRRYSAPEIEEKLLEAELDPVRITYFNITLLPIVAVYRYMTRRRLGKGVYSDLWLPPAAVNRMFASLLAWEARMALKRDLPNGSSLMVLCTRPIKTVRATPKPSHELREGLPSS
jgi:SAM-dependent methyltransferase